MSKVFSVQVLNANAPVFIVDVTCGGRGYLRAEPLPCQSIREKAREEFSERPVLGKAQGAGSHEDRWVGPRSIARLAIEEERRPQVACSRRLARLTGHAGWVAGMDSASGHRASRHGEVKTAGGLPAKVGTTRLSYGVGGRDGRPLVIARLAMEK
ncbi:hypothetical protein CDL15_Pgr024658 [Punica granatum]|uniref:Uncharacterized protein n=1 Tax=Punica granatum TaxID=22663 RepID=A0A218WVR0_PUNGR|nr:hypothetical protein CDL15_Pgr024658 [Punica granatum]